MAAGKEERGRKRGRKKKGKEEEEIRDFAETRLKIKNRRTDANLAFLRFFASFFFPSSSSFRFLALLPLSADVPALPRSFADHSRNRASLFLSLGRKKVAVNRAYDDDDNREREGGSFSRREFSRSRLK